MGSIQAAGSYDLQYRKHGPTEISSVNQRDIDNVRFFDIDGIISDEKSTPTGAREELLFLAWLLVLLRTREDDQISYGWEYKGLTKDFEHELVENELIMSEVVTGLQDSVGQVAQAISRHITTITLTKSVALSRPVSLLLRTSVVSKTSEESNNEGGIQLEVWLSNSGIQIRPLWHSSNVLHRSITRHVDSFVDMVKLCLQTPNATIEDCIRPTACDLDEIWEWNHLLPSSYNFCMHDMVSEQAQRYPNKTAISSWNGNLTYAQVEHYSTLVACSLIDMGVELHDIVPICFEKSRWTIVAVLAAMKAGSTFVLMDPTLPLARLQNMAEQVGAKSMLTSRLQHDLSTSILPSGKFLVVDVDTFAHLSDFGIAPNLPSVPPSALMYIIFTSGSTGTPKGVKISHKTYTSSAIPRAQAVGYMENSRVLDFASYAFDVSIDSMLLTLGHGGCLCIPSDEERLNDINAAIRDMRINYAGLTPSLARILDADVISSLSALGLGGEAVSARDVTVWGRETRIVIGYGPCECTIGCTINSSAATGRDYISIGNGNGAAMWIVHPENHDLLMPVGAVGELLVEGPIVGQGYLNDLEKTAAAFIEDPKWLTAGHGGYAGRRGRLYKTGDLGQYDLDGSGGIVFVGRKDSQVKLRGQRVELGEIESQLKSRLPSDINVIAEVISPLESGGQPTLVAFIAYQSKKGHEQVDIKSAQLPDELQQLLSKADTELAKVLPRYMIPATYVPVNHIPVLVSSKTDRKRLKQYGATVSLRELGRGTASTTMATGQLSDVEARLRDAWGQALKLDAQVIRADDNFFALGGDSLTVMRLVSACRIHGFDLTVANAFGHPTLSDMASTVHVASSEERVEVKPFSMIARSPEVACAEAAQECQTDMGAVEDIYPCTPTQESLFTFSLKSLKVYVAQRVASIPAHIDDDAWKKAWETVVDTSPILRTRLTQLQGPGLQQVVLKENISWRHSSDLSMYLENDRVERMELGERLARYAIIDEIDTGKRYMVWTVHHVLYDGWSEPLILQQVSAALQSQQVHPLQPSVDMKDFVKWMCDTNTTALQEFWQQELKGAVGPQFPHLPSRDYLPIPDVTLEQQVPLKISAGFPFTMATLIRGAWALVASQYTGSDDVVFGETLTGRDISLSGVEGIVGPLVATIPIRIKIDRAASIEDYLNMVQQGMSRRTPYQHMGWQYIRRVSQDAQHACEAPTGLVIQPESEYVGDDLGFPQGDAVREALHFNPYPLMVACGIHKGGFRVCANFDSKLVEVAQMERILAQLDQACFQLTSGHSRKLGEISCVPETELNQIWKQNQNPPLTWDDSTNIIRAASNVKEGSIYPRAAVPWVCDPRNPALLSPIGCVGELWFEGGIFTQVTKESPPWLVAGSSSCSGRRGNVQSTGDLVRMQEDGSLLFVRRKENALAVQGHAVDTAELDVNFAKYLPNNRAAVAVHEQELIVFVEQSSVVEDSVELMPPNHELADEEAQELTTAICSTISVDLAIALKKFDKFIRDSLRPYLVPSAYVMVETLPATGKQGSNASLSQLAAKIPPQVLSQLRDGLKAAWTKTSSGIKSTPTEGILRSSWASILKISPDQIDVDDNFFRLGGDSVLAMKLVSSLRKQGHVLTVADIFQNMRFGDAAKVLKVSEASVEKIQTYRAFSLLGDVDKQSFLSKHVQPKLADRAWLVQDVLPVTYSQSLDIKATINAPRTSVQYTMLYLNQSIDRQNLFSACKELVRQHDILRTIFIEHESRYLQVILKELDRSVVMYPADKDLEQSVTEICTKDAELDFQLGSSFLRMFCVESTDGQGCLILGLSHAQYDGVSLPRLLQNLKTLYSGGDLLDFEPFSSYIAQTHEKGAQTKALDYWSVLLSESTLSILGGTSAQAGDKSTFQEKIVDVSQLPAEITTANLLTAAWALVLVRRLQRSDVTFGNITSGRNIGSTYLENVMGPCYQFTPVRVSIHPHWTALKLLQFIQKQTAESAAHDFLGLEKIAKECTQWSPETAFFDSVVHHQDVIEKSETMSFAGMECRVEILNPHGDAASPLKVVSFVRDGETHVGVVGSERDVVFVGSVLEELGETIEELVRCQDGFLVLERKIKGNGLVV